MSNAAEKKLLLKKNEERRILAGHLWVFSNEVREIQGTPLAGDIVEVLSSGGKSLGIGMYSPHSLICCRLISSSPVEVDARFFSGRIATSLQLRTSLFPESSTYRLVHGESDFLPGLVIDRYGDHVVVQTLSVGMDMRLTMICDALKELVHPESIVARNESPLRALEGLPLETKVLHGTTHETTIEEHGLRYTIHLRDGQKTGMFLDQRMNRFLVRQFAMNARVLDCFCNAGGFALNTAKGGAASVSGIDISGTVVQQAQSNARINGLDAQFEQADVFTKLVELEQANTKFDLIILDPPSFTKSRKNVHTAKKGYRELNMRAMKILDRGGILVTASCSHHILPEVFLEIAATSALKAGRTLQLLEWRGASPDHPVLPSMPETRYLKCGVFRVL